MPDNVTTWLQQLGLGEYAEVFRENAIDEEVIPDLSDQDLASMGVLLGHRKKILKAIASFEPEAMSASEPVTSRSSEDSFEHDAERRQLTVMFCDLVGSTEMSQHLDPEKLREVNRAYQDVCKGSIERYDGFVARYMGDGVLAYFGYPLAHEDDAERAIRAGLNVIETVKALEPPVIGTKILNLAVRVGMDTGPVVVGDLIGEGASQEKAVVGETPNRAARLQGVAQPNEVVVGLGTQRLVGSSIKFKSLGAQYLKGFDDPVEAWRVAGFEHGGGRFERSAKAGLGRFVGRVAEIERIYNTWVRAVKGDSVILHVTGDAGIGKSRLVYEFLDNHQESISLLEGHCSSYGNATAYLPFIDMLKRVFDLSGDIDPENLRNGVSAVLDSLELDTNLHLPYLLNLLGQTSQVIAELDSERIGIRTREAIISVIRGYGRQKHTVLYINDCHWIDKSSEELLNILAFEDDLNGVLILCTFRPEYAPPWVKSSRVTTVALGPLSTAESALLFNDRFARNDLGDGLLIDLFNRSGGNPLFSEELALYMVERGQDDLDEVTVPGTDLASPVPGSVVGLLLQRVDALSPNGRRLLQAASVMGRRFSSELVARVSNVSLPTDAIGELVHQDLVHYDTSVYPFDYRFKHALTQEAVYSSLLHSDLKMLHGDTASHLEHQYQGRLSEVVEELVHHCTISGDNEKTARYAAKAGDKAFGLFAIQDARLWYSRALELLADDQDTDDRLFAEVLIRQLEVICWDIAYSEMIDLAERHLSRIEALGNTRHVSRVFSWLGECYIVTAHFPEAKRSLERALAIGEELEDLECIGYAIAQLMWLYAIAPDDQCGEYVQTNGARVLEIAEQLSDPYLKTLTSYVLALESAQKGCLTKAVKLATELVEKGRETGYPPALSWGLCVRAYALGWAGEHEGAVDDAREAIRTAQSKYDRFMTQKALGCALVLQGSVNEGSKLLENARKKSVDYGMANSLSWPDLVYGLGIVMSSELEEGLKFLEDAYTKLLLLENRRAAGQAAMMLGEIIIEALENETSRDTGKATHYLKEAIHLGRETNMNGVVVRALLGLGLVAKAENHHDEALEYLEQANKLVFLLGWPSLEEKVRVELGAC